MSELIRKVINSSKVAKPVGPYSHAVLCGDTLYCSGQLGLTQQGELVEGVEAQTKQALKNLGHVLKAGGASFHTVLKTTVLLSDMDDFETVNKIYSEFFTQEFPARACYQVTKLPLGAAVEIEAIAFSCACKQN